jgi:hypothetical protein
MDNSEARSSDASFRYRDRRDLKDWRFVKDVMVSLLHARHWATSKPRQAGPS